MRIGALLLSLALMSVSFPSQAGRYRDWYNPRKKTATFDYNLGIGGCLGELCGDQTPSFAGEIGFSWYPHKGVNVGPIFGFTLLGMDRSPANERYDSTDGGLFFPGIRLGVRHKANKCLTVFLSGGVGLAFYTLSGKNNNAHTSVTTEGDSGTYVQLGAGVKMKVAIVEFALQLGGRLHTWWDQAGPLASYYVLGGFSIKFWGY